jgi:hypothetical protein
VAKRLIGVGDAPIDVGLGDDDIVLFEEEFSFRRRNDRLDEAILVLGTATGLKLPRCAVSFGAPASLNRFIGGREKPLILPE